MYRSNNYKWYVLYTQTRCEKRILRRLNQQGIDGFLPLHKVVRQWSDRKKKIEVPLFPNYVFVHIPLKDLIVPLKVPGVIGFVRNGDRHPEVVREKQIEILKHLSSARPIGPIAEFNFNQGDKALVVDGPFKGLNGYLVRQSSANKLIIEVDVINQCLAIELLSTDVIKLTAQVA